MHSHTEPQLMVTTSGRDSTHSPPAKGTMLQVCKQVLSGTLDNETFLEATERTQIALKRLQELQLRKKNGRAIEEAGLRYRPLRFPDSIRVLELLPSVLRSAPVHCRLRERRISAKNCKFEALSYVWGDTKETYELFAEGRTAQVTRNLYDALKHIRYKDRSRYIWADAVCINQKDVAERGHQVAMMRMIYKHAQRVLIWIGKERNGSDAAHRTFTLFDRLAYFYATYDKKLELVNYEKKLELVRKVEMNWLIEDFFDASWFTRQWIIQEVAVASAATVIWGDCSIDWRTVGAVAQFLKNHYPASRRSYIKGAYNAVYIFHIAEEARHSKFHPFFSIVASGWNFEATDPRDRIFAMLGMPNSDSDPDSGKLFMEPDYSLPPAQVYMAFARKVIATERNLRILGAVQHEYGRHIPSPSWVPRWRPAIVEPLVPVRQIVSRMLEYDLNCEEVLTAQADTLHLRGITMGVITGATQSISRLGFDDGPNVVKDVHDILESQSQKLTQVRVKCLCWNLSVGRGNDFWNSTVDHWTTYRRLWPEMGSTNVNLSKHVGSATDNRRIFVTDKGDIGLGPLLLRPKDVVVTLFGGFTPYVLRQVDDHYLLVGECYIHGHMEGELIEQWQEECGDEAQLEHFYLR